MAQGISIPGFDIFEKTDERPGLTVFSGRQVSLDRAIRLLTVPDDLPAEMKRRFTDAHRRVAQINHPNLVHEIEVGECEGKAYSVVEEMDVPPISKEIDQHGPPVWPESLLFATQLATVLAELHKQKLAHGDLSPNAIYIGGDGQLRLLFTGVASPAAGPYVAPERMTSAGKALTLSNDVYSLGAVLYFLFTGHPPVKSENGIKNPRDLAYMSEDVEVLLDTLLAENPAERPEDAKEPLAYLQALGRGETPQIKTPAISPFAEAESAITSQKGPSKGIPLWAYIAGAVVVAAVVVLVAAMLALRSRPAPPIEEETVAVETPAETGVLPDAGRKVKKPEEVKPVETGAETVETPATPTESPVEVAPTVAPSDIAAAFKDAEAYAEANPGDLDGIISRFQTIARSSQDTVWSEKCGEKVRAYREKLGTVLAVSLDKDIAAAKALAAEGKMDEAVKLLTKYDEASLEPRQMAALKDAMDIITEPVRKKAADLQKEIEDALKASSVDKAKAGVIRLKALAMPGIADKVARYEASIKEIEDKIIKEAESAKNKALAAIEKQEKELNEDKAALERLAKMEGELAQYVTGLEFEKAARLIADSAGDLGKAKQVGETYAEVLKRLIGRMKTMKEKFDASAKEGARITLHKGGIALTGKVTSVTEKSVVLTLNSGSVMDVFYKDMDIADFNRYSGMDTGVQDGTFDQAGMLLLRGERDKALVVLKSNIWKDELEPLAAKLRERTTKTQEREMEAGTLLIEARKAFYNKNTDALKTAINKLRNEYSDTRVYQENLGK
jgi:hypothetical protein